MVQFIKWFLETAPGSKEEFPEFIFVEHKDGDGSHLFRRTEKYPIENLPAMIRPLYEQFNGMDLFDSTFQIASLTNDVYLKDEKVIDSIPTLQETFADVQFPEPVLPFMMEGTSWLYAVASDNSKIYCYDFEYDVIDTYDDFEEIITGWLEETTPDLG